MGFIISVMLEFLANLLTPIIFSTMDEWVIVGLTAILLTLLVWLLISWMFVVGKNFDTPKRLWKGKTLISLSYAEGAIGTAVLWTGLIGYALFKKSYEDWLAFIPYWVGLLFILGVAAFILYRIKERVEESTIVIRDL